MALNLLPIPIAVHCERNVDIKMGNAAFLFCLTRQMTRAAIVEIVRCPVILDQMPLPRHCGTTLGFQVDGVDSS